MIPPVTMLAVPMVSSTKPQKMPACMIPARGSLNIFVWTKAYSTRPDERAPGRPRTGSGRPRGPRRRPAGGGPSRARRTRPRPRRPGRRAGTPGRRRTARTSARHPAGASRGRSGPGERLEGVVEHRLDRRRAIRGRPSGCPGRLTTSVRPTTPTRPRDRSASGVDRAAGRAHRLGQPGHLVVDDGARSPAASRRAGVRPVPPVVTIRSWPVGAVDERVARSRPRSSGDEPRGRPRTRGPSAARRGAAPDASSRTPAATPSLTVMTSADPRAAAGSPTRLAGRLRRLRAPTRPATRSPGCAAWARRHRRPAGRDPRRRSCRRSCETRRTDPDLDAALDALDHVVDGQGGDRRRGHRLHLDAGLARSWRPRRGCAARPPPRSGVIATTQVGQGQRVAERDELARPLGAHDAGQLRDAEDVALRAAAVDDQAHRLGRDGDGRLGDGPPRGDRLVRDVDHPRPPGPVDVREPAALGRGAGSSGPSVRRRISGARSGPVEPPQLDLGAGRQRVVGLGDDREGVGGGQGRDDVAPLPARQADRRPARCASRTGAPAASRSAMTRG